ncbi:Gfo/Idh/MocA family protein [Pontibacter indicus]|uniref:Predicted dehydrogenase n=1 Tax=Pontibacter indicus TaxID=1317125 RepID=A0A1R3WI48_9BACT|nr:Gfo/Idh/MocA family oxidoreductase [Pontibacter indicus]SIT77056.1 Predicted dehydrogenase [Pontibacter indicus]
MKTIRWGIIGCGNVTEVKSGPAFSKVANSRLVAVMRRDAAKCEDYARRHHIPKWYTDADALINDPEVDAVYIATPPGLHAAYTLKVAAAGKPVYVEKPMAINYGECQQMIAACEQASVPLYVAYYRRSQLFFLKIKELIDSGAIGDLRFVNIRFYQPPQHGLQKDKLPWRLQADLAGGGLFFDLASHQLDLMDFFFGPIASASGQTVNQAGLYEVEDIVTANFRFESGLLGSGVWCFTTATESRTDSTEVVGSKGRITYSTFGHDIITLETTEGKQEFKIPYPEHVQQPFIEQMVRDLTGQGSCPSTGVSAARTAKVMDWIMGKQL